MSVQEPGNEAEWITFVSPLVRIVEEKGRIGEGVDEAREEEADLKGKKPMSVSVEMEGDTADSWRDDDGVQEDIFDSLLDFGGER